MRPGTDERPAFPGVMLRCFQQSVTFVTPGLGRVCQKVVGWPNDLLVEKNVLASLECSICMGLFNAFWLNTPSQSALRTVHLAPFAPLDPLRAQRHRKVCATYDLRASGEHVSGEGLVEARLDQLPRCCLEYVMERAARDIVH